MLDKDLVLQLENFSHDELLDLKHAVKGLEIKPATDADDLPGDKNYEPGVITAILILGPQVIAALTYIALKIRRRISIDSTKITREDGSSEERIKIKIGTSEPPSKDTINAINSALKNNPDVAKQLLNAVNGESPDNNNGEK